MAKLVNNESVSWWACQQFDELSSDITLLAESLSGGGRQIITKYLHISRHLRNDSLGVNFSVLVYYKENDHFLAITANILVNSPNFCRYLLM